MNEPSTIHIGFYEKHGDDDCSILSYYADVIPPYAVGNVVWLERRVYRSTKWGKDSTEENMRLTKYIIDEIHHSVTQEIGNDIYAIVGLTIYVKAAEPELF